MFGGNDNLYNRNDSEYQVLACRQPERRRIVRWTTVQRRHTMSNY